MTALFFVLLPLLWGLGIVFMKMSVSVFGALGTSSLQVFIAGSFLGCIWLLRKKKFLWKQYWKQYLISGILMTAFPFSVFALCSRYLPASHLSILNATTGLSVVLLSALFLHEKFALKTVVGLSLGFVGVCVLQMDFLKMSQARLSEGVPWPVILASLGCLVGATSYAVAILYIKKITTETDIDPIQLSTCGQLLAGCILLPLGIWTYHDFTPTLPITKNALLVVAFLGVFSTAIPYLLYYKMIRMLGSAKAGLMTFLTPISTIFWGFVVLKEPLTPPVIAGCILILCGVMLVTRFEQSDD